MTETDSVLVERDGPVTIVSINRPHCRNAVDGATARKLFDAFLAFDADAEASVAVFTGTGGYFNEFWFSSVKSKMSRVLIYCLTASRWHGKMTRVCTC